MPIRLGSATVTPPGISSVYWGYDLVYIAKKLITISGVSPLTFVNALAKPIKSLVQYGKTTQVSAPTLSAPVDIVCNNGALKMVDDELPSGYRRLESIEFSGNTYYETQEKLYGTDIVTMTIADFVLSGQNLFGCYSGANETNFSMYIYGTSTGQAYWRYGQTLYRPTVGSTAERTITFGAGGTTGFKNDVTYDTVDFETDSTAWIGALPNSSSAKFNGRIDGNILVGNRLKYIPCEREIDGAICYYEAVNGVVLEPNGDAPIAGAYDNTHNHVTVVGTPEILAITAEDEYGGDIEQTASVKNLFAVGDYADTQDVISGTVTRKCAMLVLDGTESWAEASTASVTRYRVAISDAVGGTARSAILSTHFSYASSGQPVDGAFLSTKYLYVIPDQAISTVEAFAALLAEQYTNGTPVIVIYPLAEPVTEHITPQPLSMANGSNTIEVVSNVGNVELQVEAWAHV